tara:strand:+ start:784 stop:1899 length:1116 start_codon:yes stop_codon:yes gene_type:complete
VLFVDNYSKKRINLISENFNSIIISLKNNSNSYSNYFDLLIKPSKKNILNKIFPIRIEVEKVLKVKQRQYPEAIHHFEYLNTASASIGNEGNFIWSNHDHVSKRFITIYKQRIKQGIKRNYLQLWFRYFCLKLSEHWVANNCKMVLTVSDTETEDYKVQLPKANFQLLPWSWAEEFPLAKEKKWFDKDKLTMLHLGSLNSIVPYSSLYFILKEVFPLIDSSKLKRISLYVVGANDIGTCSKTIEKLSSNYKNVHITGYVKHLDNYFHKSDIQLVGLQFATGLRTRIVESFARGLPVLSTREGSKGLYGLKNNKNIILADTAQEFANKIEKIIESPEKLKRISTKGLELYHERYSRKIHSNQLSKLLKKYIP